MNTLQHQLYSRMEAKKLTPKQLERQAGLKMSAVRNILRGQSKKPSAEALISIAQVLECSVEHLYGKQEIKGTGTFQNTKTYPETIKDMNLFTKTMKEIAKLLEEKLGEVSFHDNAKFDVLSSVIWDTYIYSTRNSAPEVETRFAEWLIEKNICG